MQKTVSPTPSLRRLKSARAEMREQGHHSQAHRLRVACARLEVWLGSRPDDALRDELRWLRSKAAALRELDMCLERRPSLRSKTSWQNRHREARTSLADLLDGDRVLSLLEKLDRLKALPLWKVVEATRRLARKVLSAQPHWHRSKSLHSFRRVVRRLRYSVEWQGQDSSALSRLQDALGEAHDCSVLLEDDTRDDGRARRRRLKRERRSARKEARRLWLGLEERVTALAR